MSALPLPPPYNNWPAIVVSTSPLPRPLVLTLPVGLNNFTLLSIYAHAANALGRAWVSAITITITRAITITIHITITIRYGR